VLTVGGGILIVFSLWWLYFANPAAEHLTNARSAFIWGYGHYVIFGAGAAVGSGLAVASDHAVHEGHTSALVAAAAVTIPVAIFLLAPWILRLKPTPMIPVAAALALALTWTPFAVPLTGLLLVGLVAALLLHGRSDEDGAEKVA
jgi:low temperature requirement protein LtrA